ncbi:MAG: pyruvate dehydrogenase complex dihydrolipoamide acetyltransferase [Paracoccaceae bacterium]
MPTKILMPALSPTMEAGTLAKWLVKEGDSVQSGDVIAEIETDKATMEFEAVDEGVIGKIYVAEGTENVAVNSAIAVLLEEGETAEDLASSGGGGKAEAESAKPQDAKPSQEPSEMPANEPSAAPQTASAPAPKGSRVFASPLARRLAAEKGVDLSALQGSGPHGRIVKADVEEAAQGQPARAASPALVGAPASMPAGPAAETVIKMYQGREYKELQLDGMRKTIAARLTEAKQTVPHFYLRRDIKIDRLLAFRADLNKQLAARDVKLSVNDFIIKACALALQTVPSANAVWAGDRVLQLTPSDVAVAVAIEGGLFTPVLQDAEQKSLSQLSAEMKDLAARAKDKKLAPHEYQGGSFAISNLGMFGIDNFDAVINPPHGAILAVGAGKKRPVVNADGDLEVATVMSVTLSVDHRVIDGALGAELLQAIVDNLENPIAMLV